MATEPTLRKALPLLLKSDRPVGQEGPEDRDLLRSRFKPLKIRERSFHFL